jgi:hypothetical protein
MPAPANPKIYHIVHVDKLPAIIASGGLLSDAALIAAGAIPGTSIGLGSLKHRRLTRPVQGLPGLHVGACVPFYFCSRSLMLYVLHMANNPELTYRDGQRPIVHLEADLMATVAWANANGRRWAFSLGNASTNYAEFRTDLAQLGEINWGAIAATDFRPPEVNEGKQAEFLMEGFFPWELVERVCVIDHAVFMQATAAIDVAAHRPKLEIKRGWYY